MALESECCSVGAKRKEILKALSTELSTELRVILQSQKHKTHPQKVSGNTGIHVGRRALGLK